MSMIFPKNNKLYLNNDIYVYSISEIYINLYLISKYLKIIITNIMFIDAV